MDKKKIIFALFTILLVITSLLFLFNQDKPVTITTSFDAYSSATLANNINFPEELPDGNIRFFTGSAVAELNTKTFETKTVTREFSLPTAKAFLWRGLFALVHFDSISDYHELEYPVNTVETLDNSWWLFDLGNQSFRPIISQRGRVVEVSWINDQQFAVLTQNGSLVNQALFAMSPQTLEETLVWDNVAETTLVGGVKDGLLVMKQNSLLVYNLGGDTKELSVRVARKPLITRNGSGIIYEEIVDDKQTYGREIKVERGNLIYYDIASGKSKTVSEENTGNYSVVNDSLFIFPPNKTTRSNVTTELINPTIIELEDLSRVSFSISEGSLLYVGTIQTAFGYTYSEEQLDVLVVNQLNKLVRLSNDPSVASQKSSSPFVAFTKEYNELDHAIISYNIATNVAQVELKPGSTRDIVLQELRSKGIDPNQIYKLWLRNTETPHQH